MYHPTNHHGCIPCTKWMTTKISDGPMCMYIIVIAVKIVICRLICDRWCYMSHDILWLEAKCDHCRSYLELKFIAYIITSFSLTKMITNNTVFGKKGTISQITPFDLNIEFMSVLTKGVMCQIAFFSFNT